MRQLTPRQKEILHLIQEFIAEYGMPPTRAEIARKLGFKSANAAEQHLRALQKKGVLQLLPGASRGIQLKDSLRDQLGLPLVGRVAAGSPILAEGLGSYDAIINGAGRMLKGAKSVTIRTNLEGTGTLMSDPLSIKRNRK